MPSPAPEPPAFVRHQRAFTARLRDPATEPSDDRGLAVYRELVFNNLEGLLAATFPVVKATLGEAAWRDLVRDFLHEHRSATPLFPEVPQELLVYLNDRRGRRPQDPPFLAELAHYEWVELDLSLQDEADPAGIDPHGDPLAGVPVLSPLVRVLAYRFPVHRIGPDYRPQGAPAAATRLVVHADGDGAVGFLAVNAVTHRLLSGLAGSQPMTGRTHLQRIARDLGAADREAILTFGADLLADLRERGIVLGTRPAPDTSKGDDP